MDNSLSSLLTHTPLVTNSNYGEHGNIISVPHTFVKPTQLILTEAHPPEFRAAHSYVEQVMPQITSLPQMGEDLRKGNIIKAIGESVNNGLEFPALMIAEAQDVGKNIVGGGTIGRVYSGANKYLVNSVRDTIPVIAGVVLQAKDLEYPLLLQEALKWGGSYAVTNIPSLLAEKQTPEEYTKNTALMAITGIGGTLLSKILEPASNLVKTTVSKYVGNLITNAYDKTAPDAVKDLMNSLSKYISNIYGKAFDLTRGNKEVIQNRIKSIFETTSGVHYINEFEESITPDLKEHLVSDAISNPSYLEEIEKYTNNLPNKEQVFEQLTNNKNPEAQRVALIYAYQKGAFSDDPKMFLSEETKKLLENPKEINKAFVDTFKHREDIHEEMKNKIARDISRGETRKRFEGYKEYQQNLEQLKEGVKHVRQKIRENTSQEEEPLRSELTTAFKKIRLDYLNEYKQNLEKSKEALKEIRQKIKENKNLIKGLTSEEKKSLRSELITELKKGKLYYLNEYKQNLEKLKEASKYISQQIRENTNQKRKALRSELMTALRKSRLDYLKELVEKYPEEFGLAPNKYSYISFASSQDPLSIEKPRVLTLGDKPQELSKIISGEKGIKDYLLKTHHFLNELNANYKSLEDYSKLKLGDLNTFRSIEKSFKDNEGLLISKIDISKLPVVFKYSDLDQIREDIAKKAFDKSYKNLDVGQRPQVNRLLAKLYSSYGNLVSNQESKLFETKNPIYTKYFVSRELQSYLRPSAKPEGGLHLISFVNDIAKGLSLAGSPFHLFTLMKSALFTPFKYNTSDAIETIYRTLQPVGSDEWMKGFENTLSKKAEEVLKLAEEQEIKLSVSIGRPYSDVASSEYKFLDVLFGSDKYDAKTLLGKSVTSIPNTLSKLQRNLWSGAYTNFKLDATLDILRSDMPKATKIENLKAVNSFFGGLPFLTYGLPRETKEALRLLFFAPDWGISLFSQMAGGLTLKNSTYIKYYLNLLTYNFIMTYAVKSYTGQSKSIQDEWSDWWTQLSRGDNPTEIPLVEHNIPLKLDMAGYEAEYPTWLLFPIVKAINILTSGGTLNQSVTEIMHNYAKKGLSKTSMVVRGLIAIHDYAQGMEKGKAAEANYQPNLELSPLISSPLSFIFATSNANLGVLNSNIPLADKLAIIGQSLIVNNTGSRLYLYPPTQIMDAVYKTLDPSLINYAYTQYTPQEFKSAFVDSFLKDQYANKQLTTNLSYLLFQGVNGNQKAMDKFQKELALLNKNYTNYYNKVAKTHDMNNLPVISPEDFNQIIMERIRKSAKVDEEKYQRLKAVQTSNQTSNKNLNKDLNKQNEQPAQQQTQQPTYDFSNRTNALNSVYDIAYNLTNNQNIAILAACIADAESSGNAKTPNSSVGAIGLMQLMPSTAKKYNVDPYNTVQNVKGGVMYLVDLFNQYKGNLPEILAVYNSGNPYGNSPETVAYVKNILYKYVYMCKQAGINPY